ncbi:MAG: hypothetical protein AVDCRST_MAG96-4101 [uncultured Segetibacter sp.]|uniref:Uncharacterized protein n=1 Tax=uncultured Segetibacter sp. TaxID=481133 RepID=A0A6J4U1U6_9BACT|nr:MAG: hypothetical protein AVDCRST_MAG96-4101 [uncultured Segetibacter sp.]
MLFAHSPASAFGHPLQSTIQDKQNKHFKADFIKSNSSRVTCDIPVLIDHSSRCL